MAAWYHTSARRVAVILAVPLGLIAALAGLGRARGGGHRHQARVERTIETIYNVKRASRCFVERCGESLPQTSDEAFLDTLRSTHCLPIAPKLSIAQGKLSLSSFVREGARWGLSVTCEKVSACEYLWLAKSVDLDLVGGTVRQLECQGPPPGGPPTGNTVNLCFQLPVH